MIGNKIYYFRKQRGLTLSELAKRALISKSYLSNIERNINKNPSIQIMEKIAGVLQVDLSMLLKPEIVEVEPPVEEEWLYCIQELKEAGIKIEDIRDNILLIEFIKWRQENK